MTNQEKIDFIREEIRNYLVDALESADLTVEDGKKMAKAANDQFVDTLDTDEKLKIALATFARQFPERASLWQNIEAKLVLFTARDVINQQILPLIKKTGLDQALDSINKIKL